MNNNYDPHEGTKLEWEARLTVIILGIILGIGICLALVIIYGAFMYYFS